MTNFGAPFVVVLAFAAALAPAAPAQTTNVFYGFTGGPDGERPVYLATDSAGHVYGVTEVGGESYIGDNGGVLYEVSFGTLFTVNQKGAESVLHTFTLNASTAGWFPVNVIQGRDGSFYGTTIEGGNFSCGSSSGNGCGVVFKYSQGTYSVLHAFGGAPDGDGYASPLVEDSAGNLYGVTNRGGNSGCLDGYTCGILYKIDASGNETILYAFTGQSDGAWPFGNLLLDSSGNLYGTTSSGGSANEGTVFKFNLAKSNLTTVYSFTGGTDGWSPNFLVADSAGNIYGHASATGPKRLGSLLAGNIFKITPSGVFSVVYSFTGEKDGATPIGPLALDAAGNVYGATFSGGPGANGFNPGMGVVFKVNLATGTETVLHAFSGWADGSYPQAVAMDKAANLYCATYYGGFFLAAQGNGGAGTLIKITP